MVLVSRRADEVGKVTDVVWWYLLLVSLQLSEQLGGHFAVLHAASLNVSARNQRRVSGGVLAVAAIVEQRCKRCVQ